MAYLNQRASVAWEGFQIGDIGEDGSVEMLETIATQVELFQVLKLVEDPRGQF